MWASVETAGVKQDVSWSLESGARTGLADGLDKG